VSGRVGNQIDYLREQEVYYLPLGYEWWRTVKVPLMEKFRNQTEGITPPHSGVERGQKSLSPRGAPKKKRKEAGRGQSSSFT